MENEKEGEFIYLHVTLCELNSVRCYVEKVAEEEQVRKCGARNKI